MTNITSTTSTPQFSVAARWLATVAALAAFFTAIFTSSIVNVAIPHVMGAFGVGQIEAQFLSTSFLAMNITGLLASSWATSIFGQRLTFILVMLVFSVASIACYFAPTLELLILGRVIQGLAAGILQPLVMMVLFQVFRPEQRGLAMGMFSMGVTVALGLGPSLGGLAIDIFDWRALFLVPIPACIAAVVLGVLFLPPEDEKSPASNFDLLGFILINAFVFGWFTLLGNGQKWGWSSDEWIVLAIATLCVGLVFIISQLRSRSPLIDLSLFRNAAFVITLGCAFFFAFGNFASIYSFSVFGQIVQGFTPTVAGSMLLPGSLFAALILPFTGRASDKLPAPLVMTIGLVIICAGIAMLISADANTVFWYVAASLLIGRIGSALANPAINATAMSALSLPQMRQGAGITNMFMMFGGSTGISVYVLVLELRIEFHASHLAATQTAANATTAMLLNDVSGTLNSAGLSASAQHGIAMNYLDAMIVAQANVFAFQDGFLMLAAIALAPLLPISLLLRLQRNRGAIRGV